MIKLRKPLYFYSEAEVKKAKDKPIIIHMTGFFYVINRAWNEVTNHPDRKRFVEYSSLLDWDGPILQKDKRNWKTRLKDLIIHGLPRSIVIGIVSFLYNNMRVKNIRNISKKIERKKEKIIA